MRLTLPILLTLLLSNLGILWAAEHAEVAGRAEASVPPANKKEQALANQRALASARVQAESKAMVQAVTQVLGGTTQLGPKSEVVLADVSGQAAQFVLESQVRSADVDAGVARVEVVLRVDMGKLKGYLETRHGINAVESLEGRFKVYVLAYTVEGMDPNRTTPQVLREEVVDDRKNVHSSAGSESSGYASSHDVKASSNSAAAFNQGSSIDAREKSRSSASIAAGGSTKASASGMIAGEGGIAAARGSQSSSGYLRASQSGSLEGSLQANQQSSGSANQSSNLAAKGSESAHASSSHSSHSDTSSYYKKVVIYSDPTKKGAGSTNEVRAKLGEILKSAGFATSLYNLDLQSRELAGEDDLNSLILSNLRRDPAVSPDDHVAIALNRLTPVSPEGRQYTAQVTYRVIRVRDGLTLLPDKNVTGDSGPQATDDVARSIATELAVRKAEEILPGEILKAMHSVARADAREVSTAASLYGLRIDNLANPGMSAPLKQALRSAGFGVKPSFRAQSRSESVEIVLNGKAGSDVLAVLESFLGAYNVISMDDRSTVLQAK